MDGELPFSMLDVIALLNLPYPAVLPTTSTAPAVIPATKST